MPNDYRRATALPGRAVEKEVDEELAFHIESRARDLVRIAIRRVERDLSRSELECQVREPVEPERLVGRSPCERMVDSACELPLRSRIEVELDRGSDHVPERILRSDQVVAACVTGADAGPYARRLDPARFRGTA